MIATSVDFHFHYFFFYFFYFFFKDWWLLVMNIVLIWNCRLVYWDCNKYAKNVTLALSLGLQFNNIGGKNYKVILFFFTKYLLEYFYNTYSQYPFITSNGLGLKLISIQYKTYTVTYYMTIFDKNTRILSSTLIRLSMISIIV